MRASLHMRRILSSALTRPAFRFPTTSLRSSSSTTLSAESLAFFDDLLGAGGVVRSPGPEFTTDWTDQYEGQSDLMLRPRTTEELSAVMKHCYAHDLEVVPQGGKTGLVGGGVPTARGEIVLNTSRMKDVLSFDDTSGVLVCQAG